jgi:hypothetical protein
VADDQPSRLALLIAIPLTYTEFVHRVGNSDWLSKFNDAELAEEERVRELETRWRSEYAVHVADPLRRLVDTAQGLGVSVETQATLQDLRGASEKSSIVILFAHWKGPEVVHDDLVSPVDSTGFVDRVRSDETPLGAWLRSRLVERRVDETMVKTLKYTLRAWFGRNASPPSLIDVLAEALALPANVDTQLSQGVDCVLEAEVTRLARRRDVLDRLFEGLLRPGNRLELFEGLYDKEDVERVLADHFEGILDLTTCTSTVLADHIDRQRNGRVRTVQFPTVQEPGWAARCIELALRLAVEQTIPYQEARVLATAILQRAVSDESGRP